MTTRMLALLNEASVYVLPSTPGNLKSGAAVPMVRVFGSSGVANKVVVSNVATMHDRITCFICQAIYWEVTNSQAYRHSTVERKRYIIFTPAAKDCTFLTNQMIFLP